MEFSVQVLTLILHLDLHTQLKKSAEILVKVLSITPNKLQTIKPDQFRSLAKDFKVTLHEEFLYEK